MAGIFAADGTKHVLGKGAVLFNRFVDGTVAGPGLRFVGNVDELTIGTEDEVQDKYSSVERNSPLIASVPTRRTVELVATMTEFQSKNLALALMGSDVNTAQGSATGQAYQIVNAQKGYTYKIPAFMLSNVVVKVAAATKTLGTDYTIEVKTGLIYIVPAGTIANDDEVDITYDRALITAGIDKVRGGISGKIEGELMFRSDNLNGPNYLLRAWKVSIQPEGETGLISEEFGSFQMRMRVLDDSINHSGEGLYTLETFTGLAPD